ncbi:MAG: hypothetical protein NTV43_17685 [Methylococcales bacterium]|nr:hypothetical protein [Methylococcales bacterium]
MKKIRANKALHLSTKKNASLFGGSVVVFGGWWLAFAGNAKPNKSVKGTRRPLAVLKFGFYQSSAASLKPSEQRAPYRNVRLYKVTSLKLEIQ